MSLFLLTLALLSPALGQSCKSLVIGKTSYAAALQDNVCIYSNVRFATPPEGDLRFASPQPPTDNDPPAPTQPVSCVAMDPGATCAGRLIGDARCNLSSYKVGIEQEDCLFLDIYVPASSVVDKMPVVVWIYGGAFVFGSKHGFDLTSIPLYSGSGPISNAVTPTIFVAINYRLGAYGWLAGDYMESLDESASPNAGLADQLAAMNFVRDNIAQLGGDGSQISVWGESAGASSILHHLVSTETVPFKRALLQSPAFQWLWDRKGGLNATYTNFSTAVGCPNGDISCVRSKDAGTLQQANQNLWQDAACNGIFPVGPAVDGKIIKTLPPVALANGQMQSIDSIIVSHVGMEVGPKSPFVPSPITNDPTNASKVTDFLKLFMGNNSAYLDLVNQIETQYPNTSSKYSDQAGRAAQIITDSSFVCNTRNIIDAYSGKSSVYAMEYDFLAKQGYAVHGTDLLPTFSDNTNYTNVLHTCFPKISEMLLGVVVGYINKYTAPGMQRYFMAHAATGNPNNNVIGKWSQASIANCRDSSQGSCVQNIMQAHFVPAFTYGNEDAKTSSSTCGFWRNISAQIMEIYSKEQSQSEQSRVPMLVQEL